MHFVSRIFNATGKAATYDMFHFAKARGKRERRPSPLGTVGGRGVPIIGEFPHSRVELRKNQDVYRKNFH